MQTRAAGDGAFRPVLKSGPPSHRARAVSVGVNLCNRPVIRPNGACRVLLDVRLTVTHVRDMLSCFFFSSRKCCWQIKRCTSDSPGWLGSAPPPGDWLCVEFSVCARTDLEIGLWRASDPLWTFCVCSSSGSAEAPHRVQHLPALFPHRPPTHHQDPKHRNFLNTAKYIQAFISCNIFFKHFSQSAHKLESVHACISDAHTTISCFKNPQSKSTNTRI